MVATFNSEVAARVEEAGRGLARRGKREVFLMREVMDMPFAEIAAAVWGG
jgi:hypothetical protein